MSRTIVSCTLILYNLHVHVQVHVFIFTMQPVVVQVRELEGEIQELLCKIRDLERANSTLHNKVWLVLAFSVASGKM